MPAAFHPPLTLSATAVKRHPANSQTRYGMSRPLSFVLLLATLVVVGCASAGNPTAQAARGNSNVIQTEEIRAANLENVYDLVRSRRPTWLRQRGNQTFQNDAGIVVYLDQARVGGIESMRQIHPQTISSVSFLDAREANFRFGQGHLHGAIVISTQETQ